MEITAKDWCIGNKKKSRNISLSSQGLLILQQRFKRLLEEACKPGIDFVIHFQNSSSNRPVHNHFRLQVDLAACGASASSAKKASNCFIIARVWRFSYAISTRKAGTERSSSNDQKAAPLV